MYLQNVKQLQKSMFLMHTKNIECVLNKLTCVQHKENFDQQQRYYEKERNPIKTKNEKLKPKTTNARTRAVKMEKVTKKSMENR